MTTRYAVERGETATCSNHWTFPLGGAAVASAVTAEVAHRQSDWAWLPVIDNPYGGGTPPKE